MPTTPTTHADPWAQCRKCRRTDVPLRSDGYCATCAAPVADDNVASDNGTAPTYKHPISGRYYRTMTPRATGLPVTVGHGDDLGLGVAEDGAWWAYCDAHGWAYSYPTQIAARYGCAKPQDWCPTCQGGAE